jgi:PPP family 3-phenylpropionic acid transporter
VSRKPSPIFVSAALYFAYYMALGAYMPYINLYYERLGLSGVEIGALAALSVLVSMASVLFWGALADTRQWHRPILRLALVMGIVFVLLISTAGSFGTLIPFVVAYALFTSPIVPILDSASLEAVEGTRRTYGDLRLWGSVGWVFSSIIVGYVIQQQHIGWLFYAFALLLTPVLLLSFLQGPRRRSAPASVRHGVRELVANYPFALFLLSVFLLSLTTSAALSFFSIYLDSIGAGEGSIGLGWAVAAISEIPVMLYSGKIIKRIGSTGLLKIAFIALAVRWLLYSIITDPTLVIILQLLGGISFATYLVGGVTYVSERAPAGLGTTAQSVYNLASFGAGFVAGSLVGGYLYETAGVAWLFRLLGLIVIVAYAIFLLSRRLAAPPLAEATAD